MGLGSFFCHTAIKLNSCMLLKPPQLLRPVRTINLYEMSSVILDKLDEIGQETADIYLADNISRLYKKSDVEKLLKLDETDKIPYVAEDMDCDDFAGILYGEFCKQKAFPGGIIQTNVHRLNWFIDEAQNFYFIEPQTDKMSQRLESWQGLQILMIMS